jgi:predicted nucleotidyltransferase
VYYIRQEGIDSSRERPYWAGLEDQITIAFVFGSVAQGSERVDSDLDLFVIGTAGYSIVTERLYPIEERLGRRVQVIYFDPTSAQDRKSLRKASMKAIFAGLNCLCWVTSPSLPLFSMAIVRRRMASHEKGTTRQSDQGHETLLARGHAELGHAQGLGGACCR